MPTPLTRTNIIVTFLALLEMAKLKMIKVYQAGSLESIYLTGVMEEVRKEDFLHLVDSEVASSTLSDVKGGTV